MHGKRCRKSQSDRNRLFLAATASFGLAFAAGYLFPWDEEPQARKRSTSVSNSVIFAGNAIQDFDSDAKGSARSTDDAPNEHVQNLYLDLDLWLKSSQWGFDSDGYSDIAIASGICALLEVAPSEKNAIDATLQNAVAQIAANPWDAVEFEGEPDETEFWQAPLPEGEQDRMRQEVKTVIDEAIGEQKGTFLFSVLERDASGHPFLRGFGEFGLRARFKVTDLEGDLHDQIQITRWIDDGAGRMHRPRQGALLVRGHTLPPPFDRVLEVEQNRE